MGADTGADAAKLTEEIATEDTITDSRVRQMISNAALYKSLVDWIELRDGILSVVMMAQQAVATIWFWTANIHDQLHAVGVGENTATWLGGGELFLIMTAVLQLRMLRTRRTWRNYTLVCIQVLSAIGSTVALGIFAYRRFALTPSDIACLQLVAVGILAVFGVYCARHMQHGLGRNLRAFAAASWTLVLLAIALRAVPRLFQGASLFINNPMSLQTVLSGLYIALVRVGSVWLVNKRAPSRIGRQAWHMELLGNLGSQLLLSLGWLLAILSKTV